MKKSRVCVSREGAVRSWSRREVLARGAGVASVLALPQLWIPKAWGATGFDYYISTSGNDSNPGTLAAPWALTSFQNTSPNNARMAGKRIGIIAGNYSMAGITTSNPTDYTWSLLSIPGGSSSAPTYVASCDTSGNYSARASKITWTGASTGNGLMGGAPNQSYITIDGIVINGNNCDLHIVQFYGSFSYTSSSAANVTGILVQNCELYGVNNTGGNGQNVACVFLEGVYNSTVQNNSLHDVSYAAEPDHGHAIEEYGCHNNQHIYNTIYNCPSGIEAKAGCTGTVAAYNYFYNVAVAGVAQCSVFEGFDGASGSPSTGPAPMTYVIHHNVVDSCGPLHAADLNTNFTSQAINCYNNTVYDTRSGSNSGWQLNSSQPKLIQFNNNIYVTTASSGGGNIIYQGKINVASGGYATLDNNCYYAANGNYSGMWGLGSNPYSSLSAWQSATGAEAHSITSNPGFASAIKPGAGAAQFQLSSSSPCPSAGAWANGTTQVGCNFTSGSTGSAQAVPDAPTLTVS